MLQQQLFCQRLSEVYTVVTAQCRCRYPRCDAYCQCLFTVQWQFYLCPPLFELPGLEPIHHHGYRYVEPCLKVINFIMRQRIIIKWTSCNMSVLCVLFKRAQNHPLGTIISQKSGNGHPRRTCSSCLELQWGICYKTGIQITVKHKTNIFWRH